jgi:hypothetical protein
MNPMPRQLSADEIAERRRLISAQPWSRTRGRKSAFLPNRRYDHVTFPGGYKDTS